MASKSKKRAKRQSHSNPLDSVKRNLEKGEFKQALKEARACHRQSPTPECRCFLEHAYIGRAQQLARNGLIDDSRRIVCEMLDLGVTEPAVRAVLPEVLLSVGLLDRLPQGSAALSGDQGHRLLVKAADAAVLNPENAPSSMSELKIEARKIRAALEAVERDDEPEAQHHLKDISRQSVFADWKLFTRGLVAYYRRDMSALEANWGRLDPNRTAITIARPLQVMVGLEAPREGGTLRAKVRRVEKLTNGQSALGDLVKLRQRAADHDWPRFFKTLRLAHSGLRELDPGVYHAVVSHLCGIMVRDGLVDELRKFAAIVEPLPIDPHWNRALALAWENTEWEDDSENCWQRYLHDLEGLSEFSPSQKRVARGLIWLRLTEPLIELAHDLRRCPCGANHSEEVADTEDRVRTAFEQCFSDLPDHTPAYVSAAQFHAEAGRDGEAAEVYARLLERAPENVEALTWLAEHHLAQGDAGRSCQYAIRARELKPLDRKTGELLWASHIAAARKSATAGRYDEARNEIAAADRAQPARASNYDMLARKTILEAKAGDLGASRQLIVQAQECLEEPTALWLAMTVESVLWEMPLEDVWLYEERWRKALKRRCHGATAGRMCQMMLVHMRLPVPYADCQKHARDLAEYVRRCTRVKWDLEDLRTVCDFLVEVERPDLLKKYVKIGVRKFPQVAFFHFRAGVQEMERGPFAFKRSRAIEHLQRAVELASRSTDPRDGQIESDARRCLGLAEHVPDPRDFRVENEGDDGAECLPSPLKGLPPDAVLKILEKACARLGLDPQAVMDEIDRDRL